MADTEREAFETKYRGALDLTPCAENDGYMAYSTYCAWRAWKDRGAALASRPAEVDDEGLPDLPEPVGTIPMYADDSDGNQTHEVDGYTAEQYRQGQRDAVTAYKRKKLVLQQLADQAQELDMGYGAAPSHTTNKEK